MIECESAFTPTAVGDKWLAYGLCQMHKWYHSIPAEYYQDWGYQIDYCYDKRKGGTRFYWPNRKIYSKGKFIWICSDVVKKRFKIDT